MNNNNELDITINPNYVRDWTFMDAIRELIQNGIDAESQDSSNKFSMEYDESRKTILLSNKKSKLKRNTLLFGSSSKTNSDNTVGQFGEGYKIASLIMNRLEKTFTIYNNEYNEVWTSKIKNSQKWLDKVLAFYIEKNETSDTGLVIEVGNVSTSEYLEIADVWLDFYEEQYGAIDKFETEYGYVITDEDFIGQIYVNGLHVSHMKEFKYGYNFKPKYIPLERDRKTARSWDVQETTAKMLAEGTVNGYINLEQTTSLLSENTLDVHNMYYNRYLSNVKDVARMLYEEFKRENPKEYCFPVSDDKEYKIIKNLGGIPIRVASQVKNLLEDKFNSELNELKKRPTVEKKSNKQRFKDWFYIYGDDLSCEASDFLLEILEDLYVGFSEDIE